MTTAFGNAGDFRNVDSKDPHSFLNIFSLQQRRYINRNMPVGEGYLLFNEQFVGVKDFEDGDMLFVGAIKYATPRGAKLFKCYMLYFRHPNPNGKSGHYDYYQFYFDIDVDRIKYKSFPINKYLYKRCQKDQRLWSGVAFPTKKKEDKYNDFVPEYTGFLKGVCRESYLVPLQLKLWMKQSEINQKWYFRVFVESTYNSPYQYKYYVADQQQLLAKSKVNEIDKLMDKTINQKLRQDYKIYVNQFKANNPVSRPKFVAPTKIYKPLEYEGRRIRKQAYKEQAEYNNLW